MAGVSSRIGTFGLAAQSAKGSAAASPTSSFFFAGSPSLSPVKETARYTMTDSGRDLQGSFTSAYRVEGDVPLYLHPQNIGILFYGALGANADTGTTNYTHTITPADDLPYMTM